MYAEMIDELLLAKLDGVDCKVLSLDEVVEIIPYKTSGLESEEDDVLNYIPQIDLIDKVKPNYFAFSNNTHRVRELSIVSESMISTKCNSEQFRVNDIVYLGLRTGRQSHALTLPKLLSNIKIFRVKENVDYVNATYLMYWIFHVLLVNKTLNQSNLSDVRIPIPSEKLQVSIVSEIDFDIPTCDFHFEGHPRIVKPKPVGDDDV